MTSTQIKQLMDQRKAAVDRPPATAAGVTPTPRREKMPRAAEPAMGRPVLPAGIERGFLASTQPLIDGLQLVYRAALLGQVRLHFARATCKIDTWEDRALLADPIHTPPWDRATRLAQCDPPLEQHPARAGRFAPAPSALLQLDFLSAWEKQLKEFCYRTQVLAVWKSSLLKEYSLAGESEADFRVRLAQLVRQKRDLKMEQLRQRYAGRLAKLKDRIGAAEAQLAREQTQYRRASVDTAISVGSSLLGALLGRKLASRTNVRRASSSMRRVGSAARQYDDVRAAQDKLEQYQRQLADLENRFGKDLQAIEQSYRLADPPTEYVPLRPRKADIQVRSVAVVWTPWYVDRSGLAKPAFEASLAATEQPVDQGTAKA